MRTRTVVQVVPADRAEAFAVGFADRGVRHFHQQVFADDILQVEVAAGGQELLGVLILALVVEAVKLLEPRVQLLCIGLEAAGAFKIGLGGQLPFGKNALLGLADADGAVNVAAGEVIRKLNFGR